LNIPVQRWRGTQSEPATDALALEVPLEVRVEYSFKDRREVATLGLTLCTPGEEENLACGLLYAESWLTEPSEIAAIHVQPGSVVVSLRDGVEPPSASRRHLLRTSACGLCGREELPASPSPMLGSSATIPVSLLYQLPDRLAAAQPGFERTGGLHAAALFTLTGELLSLHEDIGRHNALDKLIGHHFRAGALPLHRHLVLLSGRAGYELVQKCAAASTALIAAIGAPSSMAVDLARRQNITLIGFLRKERCNVYSHPSRVV
jgi:FdhD protein